LNHPFILLNPLPIPPPTEMPEFKTIDDMAWRLKRRLQMEKDSDGNRGINPTLELHPANIQVRVKPLLKPLDKKNPTAEERKARREYAKFCKLPKKVKV
jgi:hypothetical protein